MGIKIDHILKVLPAYYEPVILGDKTFEVRYNFDRGFQKWDIVLIKEYEKNIKMDK